MIDAFSPFLAVRYLLTRRINLLGVTGVMFAVWAIILVDSVFTGFVTQIRTDVRNSASDLIVTGLPHDTDYRKLRPAFANDADVIATAPRLQHFGLLQPLRDRRMRWRDHGSSQVDFNHTESGYALLLGIDPDLEEGAGRLRQWLQRGPEELAQRHPNDGPFWPSPVFDDPDAERREMLRMPNAAEWRARVRAELPHEADRTLHESIWPGVLFSWKRIEQMLRLPDPAEPFDLVCAAFQGAKGTEVTTSSIQVAFAGTYATGARQFDETTVMLPIKTLRTLLGQDPADPGSIELVSEVSVRLRAGMSSHEIAACKQRLQQRVQALLPAASAPCQCFDWEEQNVVFLSAVAHEQGMMQFVLFVVMLVAAFVIYATLHMMVTQKVRDIGILASLGGAPLGIGGVFLLCGLAVALVGTLLGIGLGVVSSIYLNDANELLHRWTGLELFPRTLFDLHEVPCDLQASWIAVVAIGAIVLALVVAYLPSRQAARLHPVDALAHE